MSLLIGTDPAESLDRNLSFESVMRRLSHIELELPSTVVSNTLAPELERSDLVDVGVKANRYGLTQAAILGSEGGFQWLQFLYFVGVPAVEDGSDGIVAAGGGTQETELGG